MKKMNVTSKQLAALILALMAQASCLAPQSPNGSSPPPTGTEVEVNLLDRRQWKIGDLDAETLFFLEEGVPHHTTTVTNNNSADRWWTGLLVHGYSTFGASEDGEDYGGWGQSGGTACNSSSALPEIRNGTVKMAPGETRTYSGLHQGFPASPKRETVTSWALRGLAALPSTAPFDDWPPFQLRFKLKWDDGVGCSVESNLINGSVRGKITLEGAVPSPVRAPLDDAMQETTGLSEYVSERWLVGPEGGLANCVISLLPIEGTDAPPVDPLEEACLDKVGPFFRPQVLVVPCGTSVTLRNQESPCRGFHGIARKNRSFNTMIPPGEERAWLAEHAEVVSVRCDVRPYVQGTIVVVETPYYAKSDAEGQFEIEDVAAGTYRLRVDHEGLGRWREPEAVVVDWGQRVPIELKTSASP